jgi:hypothetical protein
MHRRIILALVFIAAATLANAASLQFGPALTAADLPEGEADAFTSVVAAWPRSGGETELVAMRHNQTPWATTRMRVRADGTVDPNDVRVLSADYTVAAAAMGDGIMLLSDYLGSGTLRRVDRSGALLATAPLTIASDLYNTSLRCNDSRCIVRTPAGSVLVDAGGRLVANLTRAGAVAAATDGFLVAHDKTLDLIGNDGIVRVSLAAPGNVYALLFDGSRYVAAGDGAKRSDIQLWSIDPATGDASAPVTIASGIFDDLGNTALAWNGSAYLFQAVDYPPPSLQTKRRRRSS